MPDQEGCSETSGLDSVVVYVELPSHLRTLARVDGSLWLNVPKPATVRSVLDELERQYPMLRGTIRDHGTLIRRPFLRFFACGEDISHEPTENELPDKVVDGLEPLLIVGAIAGGC